jgi:dihydrofolate synthase/folylpolyglutamate synthase
VPSRRRFPRCERIQINRQLISEADFAAGMETVRHADEGMADPATTFFEITTAIALWYFAREKVDWVVWETGLGGRLDATNIVTPEICIITNIGLEHQQYLGRSLAEIAAEKAGIIKPGVPVVTAVEKNEAGAVILKRMESANKNGPGTLIRWTEKLEDLGIRDNKQLARMGGNHPERVVSLGLLGAHQIENAACAVAALDHIRWGHAKIFPPEIPEGAIQLGLSTTVWPGRFEILSEKPLIVLDGAHNPAGMAMLLETWRSFLAARGICAPMHVVFASVADKDISEMAQLIRPIAGKVSLVRLANERTADPAMLAQSFTGLPHACYNSVSDLWPLLEKADPASVTLITGSLFLVGEMLALRRGNAEEYQLNERLEKLTVSR